MPTSREVFVEGQIVGGTSYRVTGFIGAGGMGSVYEVEHIELGKRFVLKAILRDFLGRGDIVARLRNECRALGRLEHPNIVSVTDAGTTDAGVPFFVMERLQGETLSMRMKRERRLPSDDVLRTGAQLVSALGAAHDIGIVHRDLKPANVFLLHSGAVKLLDFGIAKLVDFSGSALTAHGVTIGTPRYMSPEQAMGDPVDARADLYSLGLLLFEMLAGRHPFHRAQSSGEMVLAQASWAPPRLSQGYALVSSELEQLVSGLLSKHPERRPGPADEIERLLLSFLQMPRVRREIGHCSANSAAPPDPSAGQDPTVQISSAALLERAGSNAWSMSSTTLQFVSPRVVTRAEQDKVVVDEVDALGRTEPWPFIAPPQSELDTPMPGTWTCDSDDFLGRELGLGFSETHTACPLPSLPPPSNPTPGGSSTLSTRPIVRHMWSGLLGVAIASVAASVALATVWSGAVSPASRVAEHRAAAGKGAAQPAKLPSFAATSVSRRGSTPHQPTSLKPLAAPVPIAAVTSAQPVAVAAARPAAVTSAQPVAVAAAQPVAVTSAQPVAVTSARPAAQARETSRGSVAASAASRPRSDVKDNRTPVSPPPREARPRIRLPGSGL